MTTIFLRRLGQGLVVLWLTTVLVFAVFFVAPNDVARTMAGRQATPEMVALISRRLRLDEPVWQQYIHFVARALHGDLGYDYYHGRPVSAVIASHIAPTLSLAL